MWLPEIKLCLHLHETQFHTILFIDFGWIKLFYSGYLARLGEGLEGLADNADHLLVRVEQLRREDEARKWRLRGV